LNENALIVFLKYPEHGKIKTRLAADLENDVVYEIYKCFLADIAVTTRQVRARTILVHLGPEQATFGDFPDVPCLRQRGDDIGERMFFALKDTFSRGFERCVLIGSDSPDLPRDIINAAFDLLDATDVVLGPSTDGGYYLIGCNAKTICRSIFADISWSTANVFSETQNRIKKAGLKAALLDQWPDIDNIDDLKNFYMRNRDRRSKVVQYLDSIDFLHKM
jgi:hypothetical protein